MNRSVLRILDIFIVIAFFVLMYVLIGPQYKSIKIATKERKLHSNMFTVKAAIERYRAFNEGSIPFSLNDVYNNVEALDVPENPYTNTKMSLYDLSKFLYDSPSQIEDVDTSGYHSEKQGELGGISIGYYVKVPEEDTVARQYTIIGFNKDGEPLTIQEGEKERIIVLE